MTNSKCLMTKEIPNSNSQTRVNLFCSFDRLKARASFVIRHSSLLRA